MYKWVSLRGNITPYFILLTDGVRFYIFYGKSESIFMDLLKSNLKSFLRQKYNIASTLNEYQSIEGKVFYYPSNAFGMEQHKQNLPTWKFFYDGVT